MISFSEILSKTLFVDHEHNLKLRGYCDFCNKGIRKNIGSRMIDNYGAKFIFHKSCSIKLLKRQELKLIKEVESE